MRQDWQHLLASPNISYDEEMRHSPRFKRPCTAMRCSPRGYRPNAVTPSRQILVTLHRPI